MKPSIVIVGSGFAGLCMAIQLKKQGIQDFLILEQASQIGGTWRDNHYPGAACDVESHLYSFSFAPEPNWSRTYSPQKEILNYLEHCVDLFQLRPHLQLNQKVTSAKFNSENHQWTLETHSGLKIETSIFIPACGGLSKPALPHIPALDSFEGKIFHTARWDDQISLDGKNVGIIGTGASAIQVVPAIAPKVKLLKVFQRTAPWIMPKMDRAASTVEKTLFKHLPVLQKFVRLLQFIKHELMVVGFITPIKILRIGELLSLRFLKKSIPDAALREKLTPNFRMGCKRVLLSNDYYPALNLPHVQLVTEPLDANLFNGLDVVILATGFQAAEAVAPFSIVGREGMNLNQLWSRSAEAYFGTTVHGFPNCFILVGPNTGLGHSSMILMIEAQVRYILSALLEMRKYGFKTVEVKKSAQDRYNEQIQARFPTTVWQSGCVSWYQTQAGKNTTLWPGSTLEFRHKMRSIQLSEYHLA